MYRQPVFAGSWYEAEPGALAAYLRDVTDRSPQWCATAPKVLVMPHAGHRFSGQLAARAAAQLRGGVRRVVIFGPSHRHGFRGVALPGTEGYQTPLGNLPVDRPWLKRAKAFPEVIDEPRAHAEEHSLEVVLPFIQQQLGNVPILPLVVGMVDSARLRALMAALWGGPETLIVISTDLTHFLAADRAAQIDLGTAAKIELAESAGLSGSEACGYQALSAMLDEAGRRGVRLTRLGMMHSGQISGDNERVVGYGAWIGHEIDEARLTDSLRGELLRAARQALSVRLSSGGQPEINLPSFSSPLQGLGASFVTLTIDGALRGCIGSLAARQPLVVDVVGNALKAGFEDPRFTPITAVELAACKIEIALLSRTVPMRFESEAELIDQLRPGRDGLVLAEGGRRGTFLPKVWESLPTPELFLKHLKRKAGLDESHWSPTLQVARYTTERFAE